MSTESTQDENESIDQEEFRHDPPCRTGARPGSKEKIEVLRSRLESGFCLWHPEDETMPISEDTPDPAKLLFGGSKMLEQYLSTGLYYTKKDLCRIFNINEQKVTYWVQKGILPRHFAVAKNKKLYKKAEIDPIYEKMHLKVAKA
jgi:hypothetical protein